MKKLYCYIVVIALLILNTSIIKAEDNHFYDDFGPFSNVELDKDWNIIFNQSNNIGDNTNVWIEDSLKTIVPTTKIIVSNRLIIEPKNQYKSNEKHTLYIARTLNGKLQRQQKVVFTTKTVDTNDLAIKERIFEIQHRWDLLKPIYDTPDYIKNPSTISPYSLGQLTDEALNGALNMTNFIRYISYLPSDIKLDEQFNKEAQAASVVNAANSILTHYPNKPTGMDNTLFELGANGAKSSNLGSGYRSIVNSILRGYMEDGDPSNISRVGHRLWVLSPKLKKVGFGYATNYSGTGYTAMKVIDNNMYSNTNEPYDFISWPAKTAMPTKFFTSYFPWSVSLNAEIYDNNKLDDIKVELTRLNDNKTWNISKGSNNGYFNISTGNYGFLPFTIIFRPNNEPDYVTGDKYRVTISNVKTRNGEDTIISFETTFFDLID